MKRYFSRFAQFIADKSGNPYTFIIAVFFIIAWGVCGPIYNYSDTWQLVVNTSTTIITFLMVFLIQNTQNRDTAALQIKLDELIFVTRGAHNALLDLEELDEKTLKTIRRQYEDYARQAREEEQSRVTTNQADG